jgi:acyl-coenzyme A synthetase/AMP-(fatty) acid ligase/thioesterase domain-containing protein/acyl carrier protein
VSEPGLATDAAPPRPGAADVARQGAPAWIVARWIEQVTARPDALALTGEGRSLTMAQLDIQATALAQAMAAASPDPEAPIPVVVRSWVDAVVANLAGWIAGRATAHLDPAMPRLRLAELYELIEPQAAVVTEGLARPTAAVTVIDPARPEAHPEAVVHGPDPQDTSSLVFTSGSTGRPKGVASDFGALQARSEALLEAYHFSPGDRIGLTLAPSFGAAAFVFTGPAWGASLHLFDPAPGVGEVGDWLAASDITLAVMSPHLMRDLIDLFGPGIALPRLRLIAPMADKVYGDDVRGVWATMNPEARVTGQYGSTECGPITVFDHRPGTEVRDGPLAVGRPVRGVEVWIDDADETGAGKIAVRTTGLASGYWRDPVLTDALFQPDPDHSGQRILIGGDYGRMAGPVLIFMGRRDAMVKIRGYSVDLSEIERRLGALADVREVIVGTDEPSPGRTRIVAHVVATRPGLTITALRRQLSDWLPRYMLPGTVVFCDDFPRSDRGKVMVEQLPAVDDRRPPLEEPYLAPAPGAETTIAEAWEQVLGLHGIGANDDFYDLGGDSLAMVEVADRLSAAFAAEVPISVFEHPTVAAGAARWAEWRDGAPMTPAVPLQPKGHLAPFFCVHGGGGRSENFLDLATAFGTNRPFYGVQVVGEAGLDRVGSIAAMAEAYVEAVIDARPTGPLLIGGYSSGGTVALEMARRLDQRGRRPALVVLLDSHFVSRLPLRPDRQAVASWTQAGVREAKRQLALAEWAQSLPLPMKAHNRRRAGLSRQARALRGDGQTLPTHLRTRYVMSQVETALGRWVARPYEGPVLVVVTERSARLEAWQRLAPDITYLPVEGTHDSFMRPPLVDLLADALAPYFALADAAT